MVGAFELHRQTIGTIRLLPMGLQLAPCEKLLREAPVPLPDDAHQAAWEVGRLVLAPQHRGSIEALRRCLFLTLLHLVQNVRIANLFASCTPALARLYRRFAFRVVVPPSHGDAYALIHGDVAAVLRALASSEEEKFTADVALLRHAARGRVVP